MGNVADSLLSEYRLNMLAEGCPYHEHRFMSEDGICLKCEDIANDLAMDILSD